MMPIHLANPENSMPHDIATASVPDTLATSGTDIEFLRGGRLS